MKCEKNCGNELGLSIIIISAVILGIIFAVLFAFGLLPAFTLAVPFIVGIAAGFALAVGTMALSVRLNRAARCCFSTYGILTLAAALLLIVAGLIWIASAVVAGTVAIILVAIIVALLFIMLVGFYFTINCTVEALLGCDCEK